MAAVVVAGAVMPARASSIRPSQQAPRVSARSAFSGTFRRQASYIQATRIKAGEASAGTTTGAGAVNDNTWEELVLKSPVPVLVDFWAPWCGPCRMIAPIIDELALEYGDKIRAVKLNTDESPTVATEYGIRSIPTVMVFKNGQKMDAVIGAVPKSTLAQTIEKYLE